MFHKILVFIIYHKSNVNNFLKRLSKVRKEFKYTGEIL